MRTIPLVAALAACGTEPDPRADLQIPPPSAAYHLFEAGPVRPVTLTPSGTRLVVTNQPDNRIEIFDVDGAGDLTHAGSVVVGMVPVAVAARTDDEVWVVNHLSDSVSIVDLSLGTVTETLRVGDEPRDIVFARGQAFIATAHRGQALTDPALAGVPGAGDPQLTTPGVGRADVWVFDTAAPSVPVEIVNLFGDTPRALATNGSLVYAAVLHSGNQTTVVHENVVCNPGSLNAQGTCAGDGITSPGGLAGGRLPGRMLPPFTDDFGVAAPEVSVIVQYDAPTGTWLDQAGRNWSNGVRFDLPDSDVFAIRASDRQVLGAVSGVGTTLFNLAVDPVRGDVYVSNTEANNLDRLEGHAIPGRDTLRGELSKARITRITPRGTVVPHPLNGHIDYASPVDVPGEARHSLAIPLQMAFSPSADTVYVAAYGSARVGVVSTADLRAGTFDPTAASADYIELTGGGPGGLALSADGARLYTYNRFDNSVSVVDTALGAEVDHQPMFTPEPDHIVAGRPILYDSRRPTANGETSCASCHIFGDTDHLSWDLGDPAVPVADSPIPIQLGFAAPGAVNGGADVDQFHALKGPMFTQSLRGMVNAGAMHWRGDRSNGTFGVDAFDARLSFKNFDVAFDGLLGDEVVPSSAEMDRFADFALAMFYPPNPVRALDNGLSPAEQRAHDLYMTRTVDTQTCNGCHTLEAADGHFGTNGEASFEAEAQIFKIPHLRNLYTRVGMFGMPDVDFASLAGDNAHQGPQVRGYGFTHDGSVDTLFHFFRATVFNNIDDADRRDIEALMLAFDSDVAPAVGQQVTLSSPFDPVDVARTQLLLDRAAAPFTSLELGGAVTECDVVAHVRAGGRQVGMLWDPASSQFLPDTLSLSPFGLGGLANFLRNTGAAATVTCLPPGEGVRVALDRDLDGILDGDE